MKRVKAIIAFALAAVVALTGFALAGSAMAHPYAPVFNWTKQSPDTSPPARSRASIAFHPPSGKTVVFGGSGGANNYRGDTWTWDGETWTEEEPAQSPSPRFGAAIAYDPSSGDLVLAGGQGFEEGEPVLLQDTWTWDGETWTQGEDMPEGRWGASMAWDAGCGCLLLFGGVDTFFLLEGMSQTWTWKDGEWDELEPEHSPPGRFEASMAQDPATGKILLFGGHTFDPLHTFFDDTWVWDGQDWSPTESEVQPPARYGGSMVFDPGLGRVLLFGGWTDQSTLNDTWSWDGSEWRQESPPTAPSGREHAAMAFDPARGEMLLFGGFVGNNGTYLGDTWTYGPPNGVGLDWIELAPEHSPPGRTGHRMVYDEARGELVLFGGALSSNVGAELQDTWVWDGEDWVEKAPANSPPRRTRHAMAYDPVNGEVVVFGGSQTGPLGDTWVWDGETWHEKSPPVSPSPRISANMEFDHRLGKVVLFGGSTGTTRHQDTWAWDGENWSQIPPNNPPGGRSGAGFAWDYDGGSLLLFGGLDGALRRNDTWSWLGNGWTELSPAVQPPGRSHFPMASDPALGSVVIVGGIGSGSGPSDLGTWAWDAGNWRDVEPRTPLPPRNEPEMAFDHSSGQLIMFGRGGQADPGETWALTHQVDRPSAQIEAPGDGESFLVGETVTTAFSCEEALGAPGLESCVDSNGANAPEGSLDTSSAGSFTYTVTATSQNGLTGEAEIGYEVLKAVPSVIAGAATDAALGEAISVRAEFSGGYNPGGELVFTAFGPDDETCSGAPAFESHPVAVTGEGSYQSASFAPTAAGVYRWVVSYSGDGNNEAVTTDCGADGSVSQVQAPPPPPPVVNPPVVDVDPKDPPVCPSFQARSRVKRGKPQPPYGKGRKAAGFLVRLRTGFDASVQVRVRVRYRVEGKRRTARLAPFTVRVNRDRILRLAVPAKMRRDLRRAGQRPRGTSARLILAARVKPQDSPNGCFQKAPRRTVKLKVTGVAKRATRP
jgi:hypothetical protein